MAQGILPLQGFVEINKELAAFSGFQDSGSTAALDMDATLVSAKKVDALIQEGCCTG